MKFHVEPVLSQDLAFGDLWCDPDYTHLDASGDLESEDMVAVGLHLRTPHPCPRELYNQMMYRVTPEIHPAIRGFHIVAERVIATDLRPGDYFSPLNQDYWDNRALMALGERVYVKTAKPTQSGAEYYRLHFQDTPKKEDTNV